MNTPNKLTLLRIAMIPLFLVFMYTDFPGTLLCAFVVFLAASLTDMLDGKLARKNNQITDFGKFMDPLADKLLVTSALICFVERQFTPSWVVIIILSREFLVTSLRLVAASSGIVIAADIWGKLKTVFQIIWICTSLVYHSLSDFTLPGFLTTIGSGLDIILMIIVVVLTIFSGVNYIYKNREILKNVK